MARMPTTLPVQGFRLLETAQSVQHFPLETQGIHHVAGMVADEFVAGGHGRFQFIGFVMAINTGKRPLAQQDAVQAVAQHLGAEGLYQVVVGRQFGGGHHLLVHGFGGDHDEHRVQVDQAAMAQLFQQLLAVAALAQVEIAQDDVVMGVADLEDDLRRRGGQLDPGHAEIRQRHLEGRCACPGSHPPPGHATPRSRCLVHCP
jgi:hypothetical protein